MVLTACSWGWVPCVGSVCERGLVFLVVPVVFGLSVRSWFMIVSARMLVGVSVWAGLLVLCQYSLLLGFSLSCLVFGRVLWCGRSRVRLTRVDCEVCGAAFLYCLWCWWLCDPAGEVAGWDCARARIALWLWGLRFGLCCVLGYLLCLLYVGGYSNTPCVGCVSYIRGLCF